MNANKNAAPEVVKAELCSNDDRHKLALRCTWDIEGIASALKQMAVEAGAEGDINTETLLRCYGMRIAALNGAVMSYLDIEPCATAEYIHKVLYGKAPETEGAEA